MHEVPGWLEGMLSKRTPDAVRVVMDLVEAGLRKGCCSANDIREVRFAQPNVIGGTFRILHRFGFRKSSRRVKAVAKRKHGRDFAVWVLEDRREAEAYVGALRRHLVPGGGAGHGGGMETYTEQLLPM